MRALRTTLAALSQALLALLLVACGDADVRTDEQSATPNPTVAPSQPRSVSPPAGDLDVVGDWETGELLGERLPAGTAYGAPQIVYAVRDSASEQGYALVSLGLERDGRIFRTLPALVPQSEEAADGIDLYGGNLVDGSYELVGAVPGSVTVSIEGADGRLADVASQSSAVLPGWTVFHHRAKWQADWDEVQLAPVVVTTDEGVRVAVRDRSWVG